MIVFSMSFLLLKLYHLTYPKKKNPKQKSTCYADVQPESTGLTLAAALHMSATILPETRVSKMLVVAKLNTFSRATCAERRMQVITACIQQKNKKSHLKKKPIKQYFKDVQRALCEDGAEGGGQAELHQTLQMSHLLSFRFLSSLFQSAAVNQRKTPELGKEEKKIYIIYIQRESFPRSALHHLIIAAMKAVRPHSLTHLSMN